MQKLDMPTVALFITYLAGGGVERVLIHLTQGFIDQGFSVDLVLVQKKGEFLSQVPAGVRLINLNASRLILCIPALIRYLQCEQPAALISVMEDINVVALLSRRLAGVTTRTIVSVHNTISQEAQASNQIKKWIAPYLAKLFYPWADAVVAVSQGIATDLCQLGIPAQQIKVIYNPVITSDFFRKVAEPLDHPWFKQNHPPVILAVGRLERQKDFITLIRAVAKVKQQRQVRLIILGEGRERSHLETEVKCLQLSDSVLLPGFVSNPYSYMASSSVFVLSSRYEGLPTVLIEAMAAGTSVVATNCKSGPAEILNDGRYGQLVPVGDVEKLAEAIEFSLDYPTDPDILRQRASQFSLEDAVFEYQKLLGVSAFQTSKQIDQITLVQH